MHRFRMTGREHVGIAATVLFVGTIYYANWLVNRYGAIRVWPTTLLAPAGVYMVGLAFVCRDVVARLLGNAWAVIAVALGCLATWAWVSATLAGASVAAFAASELVGLVVFSLLGGVRGDVQKTAGAAISSSLVSAVIDSLVFLQIAFGSLAFFQGQVVAKLSVTLLFLPALLGVRRALPTPARA